MELQYWGTAASEGWPALFCRCDACRKARELGGANIRTRSQACLDGTVLLDFPADTYLHALQYRRDLSDIDVEPDYKVWKEYAYKKGIHPAILTYLDIKTADFYKIKTTVDGKTFVTARGWSDLSDMIQLYEEHGLTVDDLLVAQYLQNKKIAKEFAIYYDLFNKYRSDYQVDKILAGKAPEEIQYRASSSIVQVRNMCSKSA